MEGVTELLLMSLGLSIITSLAYRFLTNPKEVKQHKEEMKEYRGKTKAAQKAGNTEEMNRLLGESMKINQKILKSNMKPMIITFGVFILAIGYFRDTFSMLILDLPFALPLISYSWPFLLMRDSIGFFWWYFLVTLPATFIFRKLLGVE